MPTPAKKPRSIAPTLAPAPAPKPRPKHLPKAVARPVPVATKAPLPPKPRFPTPRPTAEDKRRFGACIQIAEQRQGIAKKRLDRQRAANGGRVFGEKGDGPGKVLKELAMDVLGIAVVVVAMKGVADIMGRLVGAGLRGAMQYVPQIETDHVRADDAIIAANWRAQPKKAWRPPVPTPAGSGDGDGMAAYKPTPKPEPLFKAVPSLVMKDDATRLRDVRRKAEELFENKQAFAILAKVIKGEIVEENVFGLLSRHSLALASHVMKRDPEDFGAYRTAFEFSTQTMKFHEEEAAASIFSKMVAAAKIDEAGMQNPATHGGGIGPRDDHGNDGPAPAPAHH